MTINMRGHLGSVFTTATGTRFARSGARGSDGRWAESSTVETPHNVNIQPLNDKEAQNLGEGGERINDFRKVYVNDGDLYSLTPQDEWAFDTPDLVGARFTVFAMDNRPWNNYCKLILARNDRVVVPSPAMWNDDDTVDM